MLTIVAFVVVLSLLVFAHELGHFIMAKRAGVKILEFGFGYPPRLFKIATIDGTEYTINALPIGGFVRMEGEEDPSSPGSLASKSRWTRASVLVAGSTMNFLLAIIIYITIFVVGVTTEVGQVEIVDIALGSPASQLGMEVGDVVLAVNDKEIRHTADLQREVLQTAGQEVTVKLKRGQNTVWMDVVPRENPPEGEGALGIVIDLQVTGTETLRYPIWEAIPAGIVRVFEILGLMIFAIVAMVRGLIAPQIAGPIGIAQMTGEVAKAGPIPLADFTAILSLNLAIIQLLPLPALDGGRLVFVILEALRRGKRIDPRKEGLVHFVGMAILLGALVVVSYFDLLRIFQGESIL
jgi:regulator of sigma E protease